MIRKHDYRVRRIRVSERDVFDWFANAATQWKKAKRLSLPIIEGLPEDAYVESVHSSWESKSFSFIVHSETFSEFPAGSEIPELEGNFPCRYETIEIRTEDDRRREWAPQLWTYKAPDGETKEAVLKAAMEQADRKIVLIPRPVQFSTGFDCSEEAERGREIVNGHVERQIKKELCEKMVDILRDMSLAGIKSVCLTDEEFATLREKAEKGLYRDLAEIAKTNFPDISLHDKKGIVVKGSVFGFPLNPEKPEDRGVILKALNSMFPAKYFALLDGAIIDTVTVGGVSKKAAKKAMENLREPIAVGPVINLTSGLTASLKDLGIKLFDKNTNLPTSQDDAAEPSEGDDLFRFFKGS